MPSSSVYVNAKTKDASGGFEQIRKTYHLYGGKDTWAINLGSSSSDRHVIAITFSNKGLYSFKDMNIRCEDGEAIKADIQERASFGLDCEADFEKNSFVCRGNISPTAEYVFLRIPYSKGWSATVNGTPVKIERANTGFMAIAASEGEAVIELRYETPFLAVGAVGSCAGLIIACGLFLFNKVIRKPVMGRGKSCGDLPTTV